MCVGIDLCQTLCLGCKCCDKPFVAGRAGTATESTGWGCFSPFGEASSRTRSRCVHITYIYTHIYIYVHIYIYMYIYMCTYICIFIYRFLARYLSLDADFILASIQFKYRAGWDHAFSSSSEVPAKVRQRFMFLSTHLGWCHQTWGDNIPVNISAIRLYQPSSW